MVTEFSGQHCGHKASQVTLPIHNKQDITHLPTVSPVKYYWQGWKLILNKPSELSCVIRCNQA